MDNVISERLGMINYNKNGSKMQIVEYNNASDILVKFEKGNPIHTNWYNFNQGNVKYPYERTVYGIGYLGEGDNKSLTQYKTRNKVYDIWKCILQRCYNENSRKRYPTYTDCIVVDEWHNFQNFAEWCKINYYRVEDDEMSLDKDILIKGNKIYSPDTCIFVPKSINSIFTKRGVERGEFPIGVRSKNSGYEARSTDGKGNHVFIGCYNTPYAAFTAYKIYREGLIKKIANEYKKHIPIKLYNAMINYKVEITD